jgi:UDP-N-acetylglucosamine 2-epimerase
VFLAVRSDVEKTNNAIVELLENQYLYALMKDGENPFGDSFDSKRIAEPILPYV